MGLFSFFKTTKAKTEASIIIENLLDIRFKGTEYEKDSHILAQRCIKQAWIEFPDVLNGTFGQRPHKLTTAIAGITALLNFENKDFIASNDLKISLFTALSEFEVNRNFYPFKNIDFQLIKMLEPVIEAIIVDFYGEDSYLVQSMMTEYKKS